MKKSNGTNTEKDAAKKTTASKKSTPKTDVELSAIEKIRKLMEFSVENGATEAEVENATKLAQRLMLKHNLDKADIEITVDDVSELDIPCTWKKGTESKLFLYDLLNVIADSLNCRVIRMNANRPSAAYRIVGLTEDREMTKLIFHSVLPQVRNLTKTRFKESDRTLTIVKFTISYQAGFIAGLALKLKADKDEYIKLENSEAFGLMIVKKEALIADWIANKMSIKTSHRTQKADPDAFAKGKADGSAKNINAELGTGV
jgi:hypothetical protein